MRGLCSAEQEGGDGGSEMAVRTHESPGAEPHACTPIFAPPRKVRLLPSCLKTLVPLMHLRAMGAHLGMETPGLGTEALSTGFCRCAGQIGIGMEQAQ